MTETLTREDLSILNAIVGELITPIDPPASLRARILDAAVATSQSTRTVRSGEGRWFNVVPGVTVKPLSIDVERDTATILMMFEPGSRVPAHDHAGAEDTFVISGSCRLGERSLLKGDFHHADAGSRHGGIVSDEGWLLPLVGERAD